MRNENSLEVCYMTGSKSFITQPSNDGTVVAKERTLVYIHYQYASFVSHFSYLWLMFDINKAMMQPLQYLTSLLQK